MWKIAFGVAFGIVMAGIAFLFLPASHYGESLKLSINRMNTE